MRCEFIENAEGIQAGNAVHAIVPSERGRAITFVWVVTSNRKEHSLFLLEVNRDG